jgi:hypothetical protein
VYAIPNYDKWKLMNPYDAEVIISFCPFCAESVYKGEEVYLVDGEYVHEECFEEYAKLTLDADFQIAE